MPDKKLTLSQAKKVVWDRMYYARTEAGKAEALGDLEAVVTAAKDEERRDLLRLLQGSIAPTKRKEGNSKPKGNCTDCQGLLEHFNVLTGMSCLLVGSAAHHLHQAHQKYGPAECMQVIDFKYTEWKDDPEMQKNIDLLVFFRPSNFDR